MCIVHVHLDPFARQKTVAQALWSMAPSNLKGGGQNVKEGAAPRYVALARTLKSAELSINKLYELNIHTPFNIQYTVHS